MRVGCLAQPGKLRQVADGFSTGASDRHLTRAQAFRFFRTSHRAEMAPHDVLRVQVGPVRIRTVRAITTRDLSSRRCRSVPEAPIAGANTRHSEGVSRNGEK